VRYGENTVYAAEKAAWAVSKGPRVAPETLIAMQWVKAARPFPRT
jgi:hypothetical protein